VRFGFGRLRAGDRAALRIVASPRMHTGRRGDSAAVSFPARAGMNRRPRLERRSPTDQSPWQAQAFPRTSRALKGGARFDSPGYPFVGGFGGYRRGCVGSLGASGSGDRRLFAARASMAANSRSVNFF